MSFAIRVENLGKSYQLGATHAGSVRELVNRAWGCLRGHTDAPAAGPHTPHDLGDRVEGNTFWALRDVSFEVKPGEVVGIIGRNGSGKSTLLKILSQITTPTAGRIELRGRVASLLEVGTGFHPELSGRENIFLNGAILGMTKAEIKHKFDEIVAFSEIENFIDTPVKRYSSGMYVRLAFAVAAHLEPEILVVDEVLAVGDRGFQNKCLEKMDTVSKQGRTVLVVTHNMAIVESICGRGIVLDGGGLIFDGRPKKSIESYITNIEIQGRTPLAARVDRTGIGEIRLIEAAIVPGKENPRGGIFTGRPAEVLFRLNKKCTNVVFEFVFYDQRGYPVANFYSGVASPSDNVGLDHVNEARCFIPALWLVPGNYRVNVAVRTNNQLQDHISGALLFEVSDSCVDGRPITDHLKWGCAYFQHNWTYSSWSP